MRMDGEPWKQPLPTTSSNPTVLEITQLGQSLVLATSKCVARADSSAPALKPGDEVGVNNNDHANWNEGQMATGPRASSSSSSDNEEMNRKFGAATTFKRSDVQ